MAAGNSGRRYLSRGRLLLLCELLPEVDDDDFAHCGPGDKNKVTIAQGEPDSVSDNFADKVANHESDGNNFSYNHPDNFTLSLMR